MEIRTLETRAAATGDGMKVRGYAATYRSVAKIPGANGARGFRERISHRAFDSILATAPDVRALINHDPNQLIGRTKSGTLRLIGDDKGLAFEVDLPNTSYARDLHESIKRGDMNGCSFGFAVRSEDQDWDEEDFEDEDGSRSRQVVRTIRSFSKLADVSVVTYPAYEGTSADVRNAVGDETRSAFDAFVKLRDTRSKLNRPWSEIRKSIDNQISFEDRVEEARMIRDLEYFIAGVASPEVRQRRMLLLEL